MHNHLHISEIQNGTQKDKGPTTAVTNHQRSLLAIGQVTYAMNSGGHTMDMLVSCVFCATRGLKEFYLSGPDVSTSRRLQRFERTASVSISALLHQAP